MKFVDIVDKALETRDKIIENLRKSFNDKEMKNIEIEVNDRIGDFLSWFSDEISKAKAKKKI